MRKALFLSTAVFIAIGCGVDAAGTSVGPSTPGQPETETGTPAPAPTTPPAIDDGGTVKIDGAPTEGGGGIVFAPSHLAAGAFDLTQADVMVAASLTIDTTTPALTPPVGGKITIAGGGASDPVVWSVGALTIAQDAVVTVSGARPLVIVAAKAVSIQGKIVARALHTFPGPGGGASGAGPAAGALGLAGSGKLGGGGGGGFAQAGGSMERNGVGGAGGAALVTTSATPLFGGSGGGSGAAKAEACGTPGRGLGGGGGGAIQISSPMSISFLVGAVVDVRGGGGNGGCGTSSRLGGGGGGGAGGILFLESAVALSVTGAIDARGGGGAEGGDDSNNGNAPNGNDGNEAVGLPDVAPAALGDGAGNGGRGGAGGAPAKLPGVGGNGGDASGGGGGGMGRIYLRTRGSEPMRTNATLLGDVVVDKTF